MNNKLLISVFLCLFVLSSVMFGKDKQFAGGVWVGSFIPQDWQIQGQHKVDYDASGETRWAGVEGFGNGNDIILYGIYYFSDWGLRLECGVRLLHQKLKLDDLLAAESLEYDNQLNIIPVSLTLLHRLKIPDTKFSPYLGIGPSIYFASWEQKDIEQIVGMPLFRRWLKDSLSISIGVHMLVGLEYPMSKGLFIGGEIKYSYVPSTWELEDQDRGFVIEIKDLNIGGTSMRLGLSYRF